MWIFFCQVPKCHKVWKYNTTMFDSGMPQSLEADVVLHLGGERYALIECKLGSHEIDDGAKHLLELKRLIIEHNQKEKQMPIREPDVLMILTGGQYAYRRKDGVYVVPIGCLKP